MKMVFVFMFKRKTKEIFTHFRRKQLGLQSLVFIHQFRLVCNSGPKECILRLEVVKVRPRTKFDVY